MSSCNVALPPPEQRRRLRRPHPGRHHRSTLLTITPRKCRRALDDAFGCIAGAFGEQSAIPVAMPVADQRLRDHRELAAELQLLWCQVFTLSGASVKMQGVAHGVGAFLQKVAVFALQIYPSVPAGYLTDPCTPFKRMHTFLSCCDAFEAGSAA